MLKCKRGISPFFAVLILLATSIMASITIYMHTTGFLTNMIGGEGVGREKISIEGLTANKNTGQVRLYCKVTIGGEVMITDAILKDPVEKTIQVIDITDTPLPATGDLTEVTCNFTNTNIQEGNSYTVTLISQAGNQFISSQFKT
jgi:hypothetical protein